MAGTTAGTAPAATKVVTVRDRRIGESSGLTLSPTDPQVVWTVNDSGDSARAFAVSLRTGRTVSVLTERTDARDCEAMASGRDDRGRAMLWIGDIGDNNGVRTSVVLRLLREPSPIHDATLTPVDLRVRYPGGPADAETLIWTPDHRLFIVTKRLFGGDVLEVPAKAVSQALLGHSVETPALARKVGTVAQGLPTDGVALPDGRIVVRDYEGATVYAEPGHKRQSTPLVAQARLTWPVQDQGETIALAPGGGAVIVGSEGAREPLLRVALPASARTTPSSNTPSRTSTSAGRTRKAASGTASGSDDRAAVLAGAGLLVAAAAMGGLALAIGLRGRARATPPH
jgi:hypothetical protein